MWEQRHGPLESLAGRLTVDVRARQSPRAFVPPAIICGAVEKVGTRFKGKSDGWEHVGRACDDIAEAGSAIHAFWQQRASWRQGLLPPSRV